MEEKINLIVENCRNKLEPSQAKLSETYYYQSLPLALIDAIYSIGVRYTSTKATVARYSKYYGIKRIRQNADFPLKSQQHTISELILNSVVIAVFAAVLQKLLKNAIDIKAENDLTV